MLLKAFLLDRFLKITDTENTKNRSVYEKDFYTGSFTFVLGNLCIL